MTIGYSVGQPTRAPGDFAVPGELSVGSDLTVNQGTFAVVADTGDTILQGSVTAEGGFFIPNQEADSPENAYSVDSQGNIDTLGNVTALGQVETTAVVTGMLTAEVTTLEVHDGSCFFGVPSSEPQSSALSAGQITFYLDESNNKLRVKVKYSGGTVKAGEIALS